MAKIICETRKHFARAKCPCGVLVEYEQGDIDHDGNVSCPRCQRKAPSYQLDWFAVREEHRS